MGCCSSKPEAVASDSPRKYTVTNEVVSTPINTGRYNKLGISTTDPSLLIKGYEDEPLLSLEEALKPFDGKISHLDNQIKEAKSNCHYPSEHNLTRDESAALYLYLIHDKGDTVYNHLQKSWDSNDREQMKPWFKYLKLLKSGLNKLPDAKTEVWQGTHYDKDAEKILQSKSLQLYASMGLSSPTYQQVKNDVQGKSGSKAILVGYQHVDGKDVSGYGPNTQKETMIWPGVKLNRGKQNGLDKNGSLIFHLTGKSKPVEPPPDNLSNQTPRQESDTKHFVCPTEKCHNGCRGRHPEGHCYGFERVMHKCSHHCGPALTCATCKKPLTDLNECKRCHKRYCDDCCYEYTNFRDFE
ncbi:unnamed protein product [Adineta steineri]|uniref:Uncharacterized protein n=1 Tax=Adineta steineri TaxID=433720 RepID=A0A819I8T5_9BILA|nr:unnamed protein product [Adineta steineri]